MTALILGTLVGAMFIEAEATVISPIEIHDKCPVDIGDSVSAIGYFHNPLDDPRSLAGNTRINAAGQSDLGGGSYWPEFDFFVAEHSQYRFTLDGSNQLWTPSTEPHSPDCVYSIIGQTTTLVAGDANRDGRFNADDLLDVFAAGEYLDGIPDNSTWSTGDWTSDGDFNEQDLLAALAEGTYEKTPLARSVPEPTALSNCCCLTLVSYLMYRRRYKRR